MEKVKIVVEKGSFKKSNKKIGVQNVLATFRIVENLSLSVSNFTGLTPELVENLAFYAGNELVSEKGAFVRSTFLSGYSCYRNSLNPEIFVAIPETFDEFNGTCLLVRRTPPSGR